MIVNCGTEGRGYIIIGHVNLRALVSLHACDDIGLLYTFSNNKNNIGVPTDINVDDFFVPLRCSLTHSTADSRQLPKILIVCV